MEPISSREYMDSIDIHYIYINQNSDIDKLVTNRHIFDKCSDHNILTKELLMKYVQDKRVDNITGIRYKLKDILVYLVDIDHDNISQDISAYSDFLKPLPILDDISFSPTMYMFHHINSIFIFFQDHGKNPPSILKSNGSKKTTKKVRISLDTPVIPTDLNKTHKRLA